MVYAEFGGQTECIMGNWKIENVKKEVKWRHLFNNPSNSELQLYLEDRSLRLIAFFNDCNDRSIDNRGTWQR